MLSFFLTLTRLARAIGRSRNDPEFRALFTVLILLLISGTLFYTTVEGWSVLDSLYFCVITLSTVGYGDLTPTTTFGKTFTIIYLVTGIGVFVGIVSKLAATLIREPVPQAQSGTGSTVAEPEQGQIRQ